MPGMCEGMYPAFFMSNREIGIVACKDENGYCFGLETAVRRITGVASVYHNCGISGIWVKEYFCAR